MRVAAATLLLVLALAVPAATASPVVAEVGTATITRAEFDRWLRIAAISSRGPGTDARKVRVPRRGTRAWRGLRDQVMQLLIQNLWVAGEAALQGVTVTEADVDRELADQRRMSFPRERDYREFLRTSGFTEADLRFRVRLELLSNRLRERVVDVPPPTPQDVEAYYDANVERFAEPERRRLRLVLTATRAQALRARRALAAGATWREVARRFSVERVPRGAGGRPITLAEGRQQPTLDRAVFGARRGVTVGPVGTRSGFYVFRVERIVPARTRPLARARGAIRDLLVSERQHLALDAFIKGFQRRWRQVTTCRAPYVTVDCANAPIPRRQGPPAAVRPSTATSRPG